MDGDPGNRWIRNILAQCFAEIAQRSEQRL
jgi:hypothetical protein